MYQQLSENLKILDVGCVGPRDQCKPIHSHCVVKQTHWITPHR